MNPLLLDFFRELCDYMGSIGTSEELTTRILPTYDHFLCPLPERPCGGF